MFTTERNMRLAVVGASYADCVIRAAHGKDYGILEDVVARSPS